MKYEIIKATSGPKHHLFGFHDIVAFNKSGDKILSVETDVINRPPLANEEFGVGYALWEEQRFIELGKTVALNYPQGARQRWLSDTEFIVNNRIGNHWGADIYDVTVGKKIGSIDNTAHCVTKDGKWAYGINYARLFRLGGYGYNGLPDKFISEAIPLKDGIYKTEIATNHSDLLVSIGDVAQCDAETSANNGSHHYVTHLLLSPNNKRIAFLHRFFLADGGIRTRLMTVGTDGSDLRCLAYGFLSHYDWRDENNIFIWGRAGSSIDVMRTNPLFSNPLVRPLLRGVKSLVRIVLGHSKSISKHFLMVGDTDDKSIIPFAEDILLEDGHPMCCPTNRNIMICDTYPHKETNTRTLFFYDFTKNAKNEIGEYYMGKEQVDMTLAEQFLAGIDESVLSFVSIEQMSFTRSGLHCDLHPRWDAYGKMVAFDSIHEGTRQIYIVKR